MNEDKMNTLRAAAQGRKAEVVNYQINIDNFTLAIKKIENEYSENPAMLEFADQLRELLATSLTEQLKEIIMLEVIEAQLEI